MPIGISSTPSRVVAAPVSKDPPPPRNPPKLLPLPDVRQATTYTCGVASLQSLLAYWGKGGDWTEKEYAKELGTTAKDGTDPRPIVRLAHRYGLRAEYRENMTLGDLEKSVRAGKPVMVTYQAYREGSKPWKDDWIDGHYSVVIGMDSKYVYLEDPSMLGSRGFIPRAEFEERWHDTDRTNRKLIHAGIVFDCPTKPVVETNVSRLLYVP